MAGESMKAYIFHATAVAAHYVSTTGRQNFGHEHSAAYHGRDAHQHQANTGGHKDKEISFSDSFVSISCTESDGVYTTIAKSSLTGYSVRGIVTADKIECGLKTVYRKEWYGAPKFSKHARILPLPPVIENLKICGIPFASRLELPRPFLFTDAERNDYFLGNGKEIKPQGISTAFGKPEPSDCGKIQVSRDGRRIKIPKFGTVEIADWTWQPPDTHLAPQSSQWVQMIRVLLANPGPSGGGGSGGNGTGYP